MKKTYVAPKAEAVSLHSESPIMTASITMGIHDEEGIGGSEAYAPKNGWSSNNWAE